MSTPEGWDADVPPEMIENMRHLRVVYIAMQMAGFTTTEAAAIMAAFLTAGMGRPDT